MKKGTRTSQYELDEQASGSSGPTNTLLATRPRSHPTEPPKRTGQRRGSVRLHGCKDEKGTWTDLGRSPSCSVAYRRPSDAKDRCGDQPARSSRAAHVQLKRDEWEGTLAR